MKNINKLFIVCIALTSTYVFSLRGRWAAYAVGKNSSDNYQGPSLDKTTSQQVKRHETKIKKHEQEINKINKNKKLNDVEKEAKIQLHKTEIEKSESYINNLLE